MYHTQRTLRQADMVKGLELLKEAMRNCDTQQWLKGFWLFYRSIRFPTGENLPVHELSWKTASRMVVAKGPCRKEEVAISGGNVMDVSFRVPLDMYPRMVDQIVETMRNTDILMMCRYIPAGGGIICDNAEGPSIAVEFQYSDCEANRVKMMQFVDALHRAGVTCMAHLGKSVLP